MKPNTTVTVGNVHFGNRLPQLSFEVFRSGGGMEAPVTLVIVDRDAHPHKWATGLAGTCCREPCFLFLVRATRRE